MVPPKYIVSKYPFSKHHYYVVVCPFVACRLSVVSRLKLLAVFLRHILVPCPSVNIHGKFYGDRPRGTPSSKGVKRKRGSQI